MKYSEKQGLITGFRSSAAAALALIMGLACFTADILAAEHGRGSYDAQSRACIDQMRRVFDRTRVMSKNLDRKKLQSQLSDLTQTLGNEPKLQAGLACLMRVHRAGITHRGIKRQ